MAQPDNRKQALQNPGQSWTQNYRNYTGRRGTLSERNNFKRDYVLKENVDARMGEGTYDKLRTEAELELFGTLGYNSGTKGEKRRFDRRFNRNLRNGRLQPRSQVRSNTSNNSNNNPNDNQITTRMIYSFGHNIPRFIPSFYSYLHNSGTEPEPDSLQKHQDDNKTAEQKVYKPIVTIENKPIQIKATTSDVANIQRKMGVPVTGDWDDVTTEAVKKWQRENGLELTGIWDESTTNAYESQRQAQIRQRLGFEDENAVKQWLIENGYDGTGQLNGEQISVWNENQRKLMTSENNRSTQEKSVAEESVYNANLPGFWQSMKEELPIYGTIQSSKRLFQNPSLANAGDFVGDLASDILTFVPGIGWAAKALKAGKAAKTASKAAKTAGKTLKLLPATNRTLKALPIVEGTQKALPVAGGALKALPSSKGIMLMLPESSVGVPATVSRGGVPATVSSTTGTVMRPGSGTFETRTLASRPNPKQLTYTDANGVTIYPKGYQHPGLNAAEEIIYIPVNKKGGHINYFQQGGVAPQQQDIQQQITQLVQAAIQGDQKATDTVNQIMQAAQQGDQQAVQLAQMIQQVVEQMKGQATMAKWGSKLEYIRGLKYAKGGKTCPSCQNEGKPLQTQPAKSLKKSTKKVEEKACGGKAKKRYFGGYI